LNMETWPPMLFYIKGRRELTDQKINLESGDLTPQYDPSITQ
jgi:hypothetical protein